MSLQTRGLFSFWVIGEGISRVYFPVLMTMVFLSSRESIPERLVSDSLS